MKINQISNAILQNDAVSNQIIAVKNALKELGHDSKIFVRWKDPNLFDNSVITIPEPQNPNQKISKLLNKSDAVFYHHHSKSFFLDILEKLKCKIILYYHNITPPEFFKQVEPSTAKNLEEGLQELEKLKTICPMAVGSEFNVLDLKKLNFSKVFEIPYYFDQKKYSTKTIRYENENKIYDNIVFVGRIAPNKKQDDLIKFFYYYSNFYNSNSRLFLTGKISTENPNPYEAFLITLIKKLGLEHKVVFTGLMPFDKLISLYQMADLFICMSEHEGFCVPIIESMMMQVPVMAFNSTSIPYTMKNCGILIDNKDPKFVANLTSKILKDKNLQAQIIKDQKKYVRDYFTAQNFKNSLTQIIKEITNGKN